VFDVADYSLLQRQKAMASELVDPIVTVPLPATSSLIEVLTRHGQSYASDIIQEDLVPRAIAHSGLGFRWHNAAASNEMLQIVRFLTISKGGVYVHWDPLDARSPKKENARALGNRLATSHAHATINHQIYVGHAVAKLLQGTPDDKRLCFVKEEVFGITDGCPIIGVDHPVMVEMWAHPITCALCSFLFCDDQFTATLERLQETNDKNFKNYIIRKTQGCFQRWRCAGTSDAAASPAPGAAPPAPGTAPPAAGGVGGGAAATTPARKTAPEPSDDEGTASHRTRRGALPTRIEGRHQPRFWKVATYGPA
jgi:hypothetical protein